MPAAQISEIGRVIFVKIFRRNVRLERNKPVVSVCRRHGEQAVDIDRARAAQGVVDFLRSEHAAHLCARAPRQIPEAVNILAGVFDVDVSDFIPQPQIEIGFSRQGVSKTTGRPAPI